MSRFSKTKLPRQTKKENYRRRLVSSYYRSEKPPDTASPFAKREQANKSPRRLLLGILDMILVAVIILSIAYSLMIKPQPKIIASDLSFHSLNNYQVAAASQLSQLKNRNKITLDEKSISSALMASYTEITDVQIELPFFNEQPTIRLTIAKPTFIMNSRSGSFIINSSGVAAAKTTNLPHLRFLPIVDDQSNFPVKLGTRVLSTASVSFIDNLIAQCRHSKIPLLSVALPAQPEELDLHTKDQPYYVKFYLGGDVLTETGQFLAARKHFLTTNQPPDQYLDVRVNGKIFYK